jgi:hypothetical protein
LAGYCGTFDVRDGQTIHHVEFHVAPSQNGRGEARTVTLDGVRLILRTPAASNSSGSEFTEVNRICQIQSCGKRCCAPGDSSRATASLMLVMVRVVLHKNGHNEAGCYQRFIPEMSLTCP